MPETPDPPFRPVDSPQLLQLLFDHAGEGIAVFDANGRLQAGNPRYLELSPLDPALAQPDVALHETVLPDGRVIEVRRNATPGGGFIVLCSDITERKAALAALADQQRMLQLLIQHTAQGIWFIDNALLTTDANPAMCRMLGRSLADLLGRSIFDFVDEANADIFRQRVAQRARGQAESYEIALVHADGHAVHCYNNATPIFDAQGHKIGAVGMFSDISRLKQAERQVSLTGQLLTDKSRVLEVTLEALSQGVLSIDAEGRTHAWNHRFLQLLEVPESLMRTRPTIMDLGRFQVQQGHFEGSPFRPQLDTWRTDPPIYQRRRRDGMVLEVQTHRGADGSMVRTYTDVTATVQAQQALQESEARFRTMADAAPAFIWLGGPDGAPRWFNQRWLRCTGRSLDEELALPWTERVHVDDLNTSRAAYRQGSAARLPYEVEFRVICGDGSLVWLADRGIPRFTADGAFEGYVVYGWDITERKASQTALLHAKEEAERANRAKSEFLSRMSHELRTPLNAVLGFAQLMAADTAEPPGPTQQARLLEMQRGGRHLLSLINDVLDLARIEAGSLRLQLVPVDLAAAADECLKLMRSAAAEQGLQLLRPDGGPAFVWADPTRLKQVLLNLLANAIKYNRPQGHVALHWHDTADGVRIEVHDTGPGLNADQQSRLFHAFERLEAEHGQVEGAGIGLALSKWLVERMNGQIGVDSRPGHGSVFWFTLAAARPGTVTAGHPALGTNPEGAPEASPGVRVDRPQTRLAPAATAPVKPERHVLYIEDNEVNRLLMEGMLAQRPNVRLRMAALPLEGLDLLLQHRPDLLLLDIQLPGIDGFEVLRRLRAHEAAHGLPQLPTVAVSANAMPADRDRAEQAGCIGYITKPIELAVLLETVDRLLA